MKITVRDGRVGRKVAPDGKGEVLGTIEYSGFLDIGNKIKLPDGTNVIVIGLEDNIGQDEIKQTVFIGSMPAAPSHTAG
jgi:hypothetical protein